MKNLVNILAERRAEQEKKLDSTVKEKLYNFYENEIDNYQLIPIKRSKIKPQTGDIFLLSPKENLYFYGRVLSASIKRVVPDSFIEGNHMVVLFKAHTREMTLDNYVADYDNLLIEPSIVDEMYWRRGHFYTIANQPLTMEEKNLDIGFFKMHVLETYFCKETGERLDHEPRILGGHGITTATGIASEVGRELIIHPELLE